MTSAKQLMAAALLLTVAVSQPSKAEEKGAIRGHVRDAVTGETLPNATVMIDTLRIGTSASEKGYFVIKALPAGEVAITASYIGYETRTVTVEIRSGDTVTRDVELEPLTLQADGIEAIGKRVSPADITPVGSFGTRVTELARIPAVGQPDLLRGVQLLPGVQAASDNSSGLYVRGGSPGQNLILLDGVVVYNPSHLFGFFSTFNPDALKNVLLMKGTFPARYGDRLSSVLDVTNLDGNRRDFSLKTSLDLISAGATAEGPIGQSGSWMVSGRRTYQEVLNSPLFSHIVDDMFSTRTGTFAAAPTPQGAPGGALGLRRGGGGKFNFGTTTSSFDQTYNFYDLNFKANWDVSPTDGLSLSGYIGKDGLDLSLPSFRETTRQQLTDWGNQVTSLRWTRTYTDQLVGTTQASLSRYNSNFDVASSEEQQGRRGLGLNRWNEMTDLSFKVDLEYYGSMDRTTRLGVQLTRYDGQYAQGTGDSLRSELSTASLYETGYLEQVWWMGPVELVPGLRFSHFHSGNYSGLSPRVSGRLHLNDNVALKAGWGLYRQYINLISVESFSYSTDMWLPVDETLKPGRATHSAFGVTFSPAEEYDVDVEFYYKKLYDLVEFQSQVRVDDNTPLAELFLQGSGESYGGEFMLRKKEGRTTGWLGYTLAKTEQDFPDLNNGDPYPPKHDRRHDVTLVLNHDFGSGWNVNANWIYATGQAYSLPESQYDVVQPGGQSLSYVHVSDKNAYRLPAYHRLDFGLTKDFRVSNYAAQFVVSVFNAYNRRNLWYRTFDATGDEVEVQDVLLQPILPSIGLKFKF